MNADPDSPVMKMSRAEQGRNSSGDPDCVNPARIPNPDCVEIWKEQKNGAEA